jgi:stearoyl-CoA desaturase (delta-9 desaturase)
MTTGMVTKEWVAVHRKHHSSTDRDGDPHSPVVYGIKEVFFKGVGLYRNAANNKNLVSQYGVGSPDDWIEKNLYTPHSRWGILLMLVIDLALFGPWGILVWGIQMLWIPLFAAGVINGIGHWWGYRNHETKDSSRNIIPFGFLIGGEELHNNHHRRPADPKLSHKVWELDIGYLYLQLLVLLKLAKLR